MREIHDHKGLSGGEKRRISSVFNFLRDVVIVLDEPLSGLDSLRSSRFDALERLVANRNRSESTIHQPHLTPEQVSTHHVAVPHGHLAYAGPRSFV